MATALRVRAIGPGPFHRRALFDAIEREMERVSDDVKKDFEKTTATWSRRVRFEQELERGRSRIRFFVGTGDEVYRYVSEGTRPHIIRPRRARVLRFLSGYTAKTTPGVIGSGAGGASGEVVYTAMVLHPGTEPRKFDEAIRRKWKRRFEQRMAGAMRRAARASGHAA